MQSLSNDLRAVIGRHLQSADPRQVFAIAAALCASPVEPVTSTTAPAAPSRFTVQKIDSVELVYDSLLNLTWTRGFVPGGKRDHAESMKAAQAVRIGGRTDWRAPTLPERLSINDYARCKPALDTTAFESPAEGWEWTSTSYAPSPADCAWFVYFYYGSSNGDDRHYEGFVRAVCPGQLIGTLV